ncbi:hypothetical protein KUF71_000729 [Frankliniella fusca]|uniref:Uncharacterized protein n=1 Tax=Frankliniella fusca TaxID=407009 RepID=A0AAE1GVL4_9NEOP|nr:hypothetical protein KUF71_000729 [Frankliniella fusca]
MDNDGDWDEFGGKFCKETFARLRKNRAKKKKRQGQQRKSGAKGGHAITDYNSDPLSFLGDLDEQASEFRNSNLSVGPHFKPAAPALRLPRTVERHSMMMAPAEAEPSCCAEVALAIERRDEERDLRHAPESHPSHGPPATPQRASTSTSNSAPGSLLLTPTGKRMQEQRLRTERERLADQHHQQVQPSQSADEGNFPSAGRRANITVRRSSRRRKPPNTYTPPGPGSDSSVSAGSRRRKASGRGRGRGRQAKKLSVVLEGRENIEEDCSVDQVDDNGRQGYDDVGGLSENLNLNSPPHSERSYRSNRADSLHVSPQRSNTHDSTDVTPRSSRVRRVGLPSPTPSWLRSSPLNGGLDPAHRGGLAQQRGPTHGGVRDHQASPAHRGGLAQQRGPPHGGVRDHQASPAHRGGLAQQRGPPHVGVRDHQASPAHRGGLAQQRGPPHGGVRDHQASPAHRGGLAQQRGPPHGRVRDQQASPALRGGLFPRSPGNHRVGIPDQQLGFGGAGGGRDQRVGGAVRGGGGRRGGGGGGRGGGGNRDRRELLAQQRENAWEMRRRADDAVRAVHIAGYQANRNQDNQEERVDDPGAIHANAETALLNQFLLTRDRQPAEPDGYHHFAMLQALVLRQLPPRMAGDAMLSIGELLNQEWQKRFGLSVLFFNRVIPKNK